MQAMYDAMAYLWMIPVIPIIAGFITFIFGPRFLRSQAHLPCIIAGLISFVLSLVVLNDVVKAIKSSDISNPSSVAVSYFEWFRTGDPNLVGESLKKAGSLKAEFSLRLDPLSAGMIVMVTFLGTIIAVFSTGYMRDHHGNIDPGYPRFFGSVALFLGSMLILVLADNVLLLYAGWEGVGLCSYLLIGFWFEKPSACKAARKAFLVTRLGDVALFLGFALLWVSSGYRLDFDGLLKLDNYDSGIGLACLLIFLGACGKSAQFPLHVWLPDAMEGPSPVSALIHAATMVTAGVYLLARFMPLFSSLPEVQMVVIGVGAFTSLLAALIALTQTDLKRILAYSTMSQLGYMFMALGAGIDIKTDLPMLALSAAIFHLLTHAFFKALLFLSAGSVMHSMHDVIDLRRIGGLRKVLPLTHFGFLFGALALAGVPPFAGFWSKDEILSVVHETSKTSMYPGFYILMWAVGIFVAFLTAFYTFRAYFLTFWGDLKLPDECHGEVHESPKSMTYPLLLLSVFALGIGFLLSNFTPFSIENFLGNIPGYSLKGHHSHDWLTVGLATFAGLFGLTLAFVFYGKGSASISEQTSAKSNFAIELSKNKFFFDEIYTKVLITPLTFVFYCARIFDQYILDGIIDLIAHIPKMFAQLFRPIQNGLVQFYALAMILAVTVFLIALARSM
ncbi:MAG: NADH-quinone oxidoreductase subunit L [Planctomycetes bacterium]|nr:NADH-quinone oxidoreductase subunit L [Planctomycetota bacterium]